MADNFERHFHQRLWSQWALSPWHCWFQTQPEWLNLFIEVAGRIPAPEMNRLLQPSRPLIVLPPVEYGRVIRIDATLIGGASIMQLNQSLLLRPRIEALALIAHELAHLIVPPTGDVLKDDLNADWHAARWGFSEGLMAALQKDAPANHPRISQMIQFLEKSAS